MKIVNCGSLNFTRGDLMEKDELLMVIEYEIGNWDLPLILKKGSIIEWKSSSIEVIEILSIELGYTVSDVKLLVKSI